MSESKLYDPLDLDTRPVRRRKAAGSGFNDLRRNARTAEDGRVVKQPVSPEWMTKPARPPHVLFAASKKGSP